MGNRLTKIYTRTGDKGDTGMADGSRVAKNATVIQAIGEIDELNAHIGLLLEQDIPADIHDFLFTVQHDLFDLGAELSYPEYSKISADKIVDLEHAIDKYNADLPALKEFILPGGGQAAAICHVCRVVCRRTERQLVTWLQEKPNLNSALLSYVNRLSDVLFVLCRVLARSSGRGEVFWRSDRVKKEQ